MDLVRWSNLGFAGLDIWVNNFNIQQAEEWLASGNDDALFQLVIVEQIAGLPEKVLFGRIAKVTSAVTRWRILPSV